MGCSSIKVNKVKSRDLRLFSLVWHFCDSACDKMCPLFLGDYDMNKKIGIEIALASIAALSTIGAFSLLNKENTLVNKTLADDPIVLTINNATLGGYYNYDKDFYTQYAPAPLSNPDSYFSLFNDYSSLRSTMHTSGSILFEGTYSHGWSNNFGLLVNYPINPIFMSPEDVDNNNPINISMFSRLQSVEIFMNSQSELGVDLSQFENVNVNTGFNKDTKSYLISRKGSSWINKAVTRLTVRPLATSDDNGKTFIVDKIVVTYYCG